MPCTLDKLDEQDLDALYERAVATLREFGIQEDTVRRMLFGPGGAANNSRRSFGDSASCGSVRAHRVLGGVNVGVMSLMVVLMIVLVFNQGNKWLWFSMDALGWVSLILTASQLRHVISLLSKLAWWGFGTDTRLLLMLTLVGLVAANALDLAHGLKSRVAVVVLLLAGAGITLAKIITLARNVAHPPQSPTVIAGLGALDRMLTAKKIRRARELLT